VPVNAADRGGRWFGAKEGSRMEREVSRRESRNRNIKSLQSAQHMNFI